VRNQRLASGAAEDKLAVRSQENAVDARQNGCLAKAIAWVSIPHKKGDPILADTDEHLRALFPLIPNAVGTLPVKLDLRKGKEVGPMHPAFALAHGQPGEPNSDQVIY
jgi:hypothetical protein